MQRLGIALFACFAMCGVSTAWAQYGMYGSPDTLPVQQYPAQAASWTAPAEQPMPVPAPAPNPMTVRQPSQGSGVMN
jgi:hypothetical protein